MPPTNPHSGFSNLAQGPLKTAAVLIPVLVERGEIFLVFTERSQEVQHHKGQVCFPGGHVEKTDQNLWETALRETHEELGIPPHHIYYIEELTRIVTATHYQITPFLGLILSDFDPHPNPQEIESVFVAPVSHFLDPQNVRFEEIEFYDQRIQVPFFTYQQHMIWGATGRILKNLLERLF